MKSSALKWIAIISMIIDHYAVALYASSASYSYGVYRVLRAIGRVAFPIYCFLLVEGFFHTHDVKKYIGRCFLFALLSEIPFDMALYGTYWNPKSQNVMFTLTIGLCTLYTLERCKGRTWKRLLAQIICILAAAALAQVCEVDYHFRGVLYIVMFYYLHEYVSDRWVRDVIGAVAFGVYEITAPLAFIPIHLYNGERGMRLKYFFYLVYPLHLLVLGMVRMRN